MGPTKSPCHTPLSREGLMLVKKESVWLEGRHSADSSSPSASSSNREHVRREGEVETGGGGGGERGREGKIT